MPDALHWTQLAMGLMAVGTVITMLSKAGQWIGRKMSAWVAAQVFPRVESLTQSIDGLSEHVEASRAEFAAFAAEQRQWNARQIAEHALVSDRVVRLEAQLEAQLQAVARLHEQDPSLLPPGPHHG